MSCCYFVFELNLTVNSPWCTENMILVMTFSLKYRFTWIPFYNLEFHEWLKDKNKDPPKKICSPFYINIFPNLHIHVQNHTNNWKAHKYKLQSGMGRQRRSWQNWFWESCWRSIKALNWQCFVSGVEGRGCFMFLWQGVCLVLCHSVQGPRDPRAHLQLTFSVSASHY